MKGRRLHLGAGSETSKTPTADAYGNGPNHRQSSHSVKDRSAENATAPLDSEYRSRLLMGAVLVVAAPHPRPPAIRNRPNLHRNSDRPKSRKKRDPLRILAQSPLYIASYRWSFIRIVTISHGRGVVLDHAVTTSIDLTKLESHTQISTDP